ncbi:MAG TPA: acyltransferase [Gammaproteobacteria bacterium]|nr:acyltransferase [Gammaproteobacteria bacterium]
MRIASIDLFRVIAILGVIVVHADPFTSRVFGGGLSHFVEIALSRGGRIAMPFFFIVAGYFYTRRLRAGEPCARLYGRYVRRLGTVYLGWSLFYLAVPVRPVQLLHQGYPALELDKFRWCVHHPFLLVFQGVEPHLWFLVALILALGIVTAGLRWDAPGMLAAVAASLYLFGLLAGPYAHTPLGIHTRIDPRNGPFFSTLYVWIGSRLADAPRLPGTSVAAVLLVAGGAGFGLELSAIPWIFGQAPKIQDFGVLMIPCGIGFVLLALKHPRLGENTMWPAIGRYVLGIYAVHLLFIEWLWPLHAVLHSYLWEMAYPVVVFALSLGTVRLAAHSSYLRSFVR